MAKQIEKLEVLIVHEQWMINAIKQTLNSGLIIVCHNIDLVVGSVSSWYFYLVYR